MLIEDKRNKSELLDRTSPTSLKRRTEITLGVGRFVVL